MISRSCKKTVVAWLWTSLTGVGRLRLALGFSASIIRLDHQDLGIGEFGCRNPDDFSRPCPSTAIASRCICHREFGRRLPTLRSRRKYNAKRTRVRLLAPPRSACAGSSYLLCTRPCPNKYCANSACDRNDPGFRNRRPHQHFPCRSLPDGGVD